jgi:hypothetical protein
VTGTPLADQFVIRLQPGNPANLQLSDHGDTGFTTLPLSNVTEVTVHGLAGRDLLTLDNAYGLIAKAGGLSITYHGGPAPDSLVLAGNPGTLVNQTYQVGATSDAGTLTTSAGGLVQTVRFTTLSAIFDTVPASDLTFNQNELPNYVKVAKDVALGALATLRLEGVDQQGRGNLLNDIFDDSLTEDRRVLLLAGGEAPPPGGSDGGPGTRTVSETEPNDSPSQARFFALSAAGTAQLRGTTASKDDKDFFTFTAPRNGTLHASVQTTNGRMAQLEIETAASFQVLKTQPNDGINSARGTLQAGITYLVRLRATDSAAASYVVNLNLV